MHMESKVDSDTRSANTIWRTRVAEFADRAAFRFRKDGQWQTLTWAQADRAAREIAGGLMAFGLEPGDRVAILCETRVEWVLCDVAISLAGMVSVPIYPSTPADPCVFVARDSGVAAVIADNPAQASKLASLREHKPALLMAVIDGDAVQADSVSPVSPSQMLTLAGLREAGARFIEANPGRIDACADRVRASDIFTIIYTSGTTGQPKGVVLSHGNLVASMESAVRAFDLRLTDLQYLFLPLAHVLGRELAWAPIIVGSEVAFAENLGRIKYDLVEVRPTFMAGVPRIFEKLYAAIQAGAHQGNVVRRGIVRWAFRVAAKLAAETARPTVLPLGLRASYAVADALVLSKLRRRLGLDRCRFLISGGAPLSGEIAEFFCGLGLLILEGYGLTETTAAAFVNCWNRFRFGTVGLAIDIVEAKLATDGEILLRGPSVFSCYHNNPQATDEAFDAEGWFKTGDIGAFDDGFLRIVDRKKDLIVTAGGKNIAPQKLENALKAHCPLVSNVVVFGDRRSHCVAVITPSEPAVRQFGGGVLEKAAVSPELRRAIEQALAEVNATLANYETIKGFAILPLEFSEAGGELTPSQKVKRDVVATRFAAVIAGLYGK